MDEIKLVSFVRKPAKSGSDYVFWIPRVYLKNNLIDPKKTYKIYLEEVSDDSSSDKQQS
jgi:hypothetical protein